MGQYVDVSLWDNTWTVCKGGEGGGGRGDECICIPWALTRWVAINNLSSYGCADVRRCLVVGIRKQ